MHLTKQPDDIFNSLYSIICAGLSTSSFPVGLPPSTGCDVIVTSAQKGSIRLHLINNSIYVVCGGKGVCGVSEKLHCRWLLMTCRINNRLHADINKSSVWCLDYFSAWTEITGMHSQTYNGNMFLSAWDIIFTRGRLLLKRKDFNVFCYVKVI